MDKAGKKAVILSNLIYIGENMKLKQQQSGFTLIELVVVIVILGILAATAIPKFVDLSEEAEQAAVKGVAANISSAIAINYAACAVNPSTTFGKCKKVEVCNPTDVVGDWKDLIQNPTDLENYTFAANGNDTKTCVVTGKKSMKTATFTLIEATPTSP